MALGLERRMKIERSELDKAFRAVSRQVHPDRFPRTEPEQRRFALAQTELVNLAYKTLKDVRHRAEYLLELAGHSVGSENDRTLDPAFLMSILEQQEEVQAAQSEASLADLKAHVRHRFEALISLVTKYFDNDVGELPSVLAALVELRYVQRMLDQITQKEEELF